MNDKREEVKFINWEGVVVSCLKHLWAFLALGAEALLHYDFGEDYLIKKSIKVFLLAGLVGYISLAGQSWVGFLLAMAYVGAGVFHWRRYSEDSYRTDPPTRLYSGKVLPFLQFLPEPVVKRLLEPLFLLGLAALLFRFDLHKVIGLFCVFVAMIMFWKIEAWNDSAPRLEPLHGWKSSRIKARRRRTPARTSLPPESFESQLDPRLQALLRGEQPAPPASVSNAAHAVPVPEALIERLDPQLQALIRGDGQE